MFEFQNKKEKGSAIKLKQSIKQIAVLLFYKQTCTHFYKNMGGAKRHI